MSALKQPTFNPAEQPILWMGLAGFVPQQVAALEAGLKRGRGLPTWRICRFGDADAWLVNGSKVRVLPGGDLRVLPGLPTEQSMRLNLDDVERPVAFALPFASNDFEPRCAFDPQSQASVHQVLREFETSLRLARSQFVMGGQVLRLGSQLRHGIFHVSHEGKLLAVLDFRQGKAGICPGADPAQLHEAHWASRPISAGDIPTSFHATSPAQLIWAYVRRTDLDLLPPRYRAQTIYFRSAPRVPMAWLRDSQLMLLRELSLEPSAFHVLRERTGFGKADLHHDLTCLYYAGAITTTPAKAARAPGLQDGQPSLFPTSRGPLESVMTAEAGYFGGDTAPASLEHKRVLVAEPG
jgi:hypothetical protein